MASFVKNMSVDHRGFDIIVAQEFLNRPDIITALQQMGSKGMAEGTFPF